MKSKQIVILGAGGQGRVIEHILRINNFTTIIFLDDHQKGADVTGPLSSYPRFSKEDTVFSVSFGDNTLRARWYLHLKKGGLAFINAIHPKALIEKGVRLGENLMIGAFAYVNRGTEIGDNVIINTSVVVEHDNVIENHVQLCPGVITAGGVRIREHSFVGVGSIIIGNLVIGKSTIIGAASNVVANTEPHTVYFGNPARPQKSRHEF